MYQVNKGRALDFFKKCIHYTVVPASLFGHSYPAGQIVHTEACDVSEYVPSEHGRHDTEYFALYCPATQGTGAAE